MRRFLALCASAALSVVVAAVGCGDTYSPGPESGGAKGSEYQIAGQMGQPVSGTASQQAQSTGPPGYMPITPDHASPDGGAPNFDAGP